MSHLGPSSKADSCKKNDKAVGTAASAVTARQAVEMACATNTKLGHENLGSLSLSHGFAPRLTPVTKFPPEFDAWNVLHDKLPYLLSSDKLRQYCDEELPVLDATKLPAMFALRAANVLGFTAHAYWNIMGLQKATKLPPSLDKPWRVINAQHLGREGEPFLSIFENIVCNFQFVDKSQIPPLPKTMEPCPWANAEYTKYGAVNYDVDQATVDKFVPSNFFTGLDVERYFFGVMTEMNNVSAPMIRAAVEGGEAVAKNDIPALKRVLKTVKNMLLRFSHQAFNKIQQQQKAPYFVDGTLWPKVVAPIAVPITTTSFGPSGTAEPIFHLLDAFFGRIKHEKFIGKEIKHLFHSFPPHWRTFLTAVWEGPSIREFVAASSDLELQGVFAAALRAYAADDGFLGRHRLKMVGYLEVRFKITKATVISGVSGVFKERTWDRIGEQMRIGQAERLALPLTATSCKVNKGTVVTMSREEGLKVLFRPTIHFRINVEGSGLEYKPGSHIGVLYESSDAEVQSTLLAFAEGDPEEAAILGDTYKVELTDKWRRAIRERPEYHHIIKTEDTPTHLPLKTFLKWGALRPATRAMLRLAYSCSLSDEIRSILDAGLESMLTFADVATILQRNNVHLVKRRRSTASMVSRASVATRESIESLVMDKDKLAKLQEALARNDSIFEVAELSDMFELEEPQQPKLAGPKTASSIAGYAKIKHKKLRKPNLCELVVPIKTRMYSVASSPTVHPKELHLHVSRVTYGQKSPTATSSPLLAHLEPLERRRGAASDYITSKCLPRPVLFVDSVMELAGVKRVEELDTMIEIMQDTPFYLNAERKKYVQMCAQISDEEMEAIVEHAGTTSDGGDMSAYHLVITARNYLQGRPDPRDKSVVVVHHSSARFQLPVDQDTPCIMFAGGTGMAPFRSFWQELATRKRKPGAPKHMLFIQQRDRSAMAFEDELFALVKSGIMEVEILFSRDEIEPDFSGSELVYKPSPGRTGYLNKVIRGRAESRIVSHIVDAGAYVYVCGRGGLAATVVEALSESFEAHYGVESGKDEMERMVAENRFILDIFTTLASPLKTQKKMYFSELCMRNDFVGNRSTSLFQGKKAGGGGVKSNPWLMAIGASVYDVTEFMRLHPGGDALLKLYCGMDATKAWEAIGHHKAPEVAAMLQMYDTKMTFHRTESKLAHDEAHWYRAGWFEMMQNLLEIQNSVALAYQKNWDDNYFSSAERDLGSGFTVWNGKATWRPRRSVFKGRVFHDIHARFWYEFVPTVFGAEFAIVMGYATEKQAWTPDTLMELLCGSIANSPQHKICNAVCDVLGQEVEQAAKVPDEMAISAELQAVMEEIRVLDEMLLENIKKALVLGFKVFENNKSPLLPTFEDAFENSLTAVGTAVESYVQNLAATAIAAFGKERLEACQASPGGLSLVSREGAEEVIERTFVDGTTSAESTSNAGYWEDGATTTPKKESASSSEDTAPKRASEGLPVTKPEKVKKRVTLTVRKQDPDGKPPVIHRT